MATTYYTDLQKLYVAYFNRPADTAGLAYYEGVLEAAKTPAAVASAMAAISASFAASAEYKAAYANMSNADVVNTVYMNLFGRAAEQAGKDYWAGLLDTKKVTIDAVVTAVAAGAQGSDLVAYNNKVAASTAFTAALGTTNAYSGDKANVAAKVFVSGVTDNASLANAIDPVILSSTVAKVNIIGTPFTLQTGLSALSAANTAKVNFLDALDGKVDGKFGTASDATAKAAAEASVATNVTAKLAAVASIINTVDTDVANAGTVYTASTTSPAVKAALLTEAQTTLAANLGTAQANLAADNSAMAKVVGLNDAIAALKAATTAASSAVTADTTAHTNVALSVAAYNVQNTAITPADNNYATVTGAFSAVITADSKGVLSLASGVTEANHPGVTALLNALVAEKTADAAVTSTATAQSDAQKAVDFLDLTDAAKTDLASIATSMKLATGVMPTAAQITAQQTALTTVYASAKAVSDAYPTTANLAATSDALAASDAFKALVTKLYADDTSNPLIVKQAADATAVTTAQTAVDALNTALSDLAKAIVVQSELTAVNGQVTAANDVFTTNKLVLPVDLSTGTPYVATIGSDIYVAGTTNASITNFGILGSDSLYINSKNTYTTLNTDLTKGNDAALEAFLTKDASGNAVITLEQKAFGSSSGTDLVTITLTGVTDLTKVHLSNGIITVS